MDGRKYNSLIAERSTKYKTGEVSGCIAQGQMDLILRTILTDTIEGLLLDSRNKEPIPFATVKVFQERNRNAFTVATKFDGKFKFKALPPADRIVVEYAGFHPLKVELDKLHD